MATTPRVSAIVVSYNRSEDLKKALEALVRAAYPNLEIIVFDNASADDSATVAGSFPEVRLIRSETNRGFAEGNNAALEEASGEYIALINNDAVVEPTWVANLVTFLEAHPLAAAAGGKAYFWNEENPLGSRSNHFYSHIRFDPATGQSHVGIDTPDDVREVATLSGCAVMIRKQAILDTGPPFLEPEFFMYYEETDFFARAARKGWRMYYTGSPAVWHRDRGSTRSEPYRYHYYLERNRLFFAYRNLSDAALYRLLAKTALSSAVSTIRNPKTWAGPRDEAERAQRDAYRWIVENQALLRTHRAKRPLEGKPYEQIVSDIHSRANYYGHPRPEVAALVPDSATNVLDVGCGAGALGRTLKSARPGLSVRGIECAPEQAERARTWLDAVATQRAEDPLPAGWPAPDCVLFADVLEHLVDPWSVLKTWAERLAPGGSIVASIPNVTHASVSWNLARGRWDYLDAGVLDRTHLRFFTRHSVLDLFEQAGLRVLHVERVVDAPAWLGRSASRLLIGSRTRVKTNGGMQEYAKDFLTVQFLVVATKDQTPWPPS